jgi:hypothetical protein
MISKNGLIMALLSVKMISKNSNYSKSPVYF